MHGSLPQLSSHFHADAAPYGAFLDGVDLTQKDSLATVGPALAGAPEDAFPRVHPDPICGRSRRAAARCFGSAA